MEHARDILAVEERARCELAGISPRRQAIDSALGGATMTLGGLVGAHWLLLFNVIVAVTLAGAVGAAYLSVLGQRQIAGLIYEAYLLLCPQRPSHSFFLWGEKVALEQRVLAIYSGMLLCGLLFIALRHRLRALDWRLAALLALPMLVDVLSQTFALRDSDWLWRTTTGGIAGIALSWWALPNVETCVHQLRRRGRQVEATNLPSSLSD